MDDESSGRIERRTAVVTRELQRFNIDIAALSETRLSDGDQLIEENLGLPCSGLGNKKEKGEKEELALTSETLLLNKLNSRHQSMIVS